jgi:hypothetical protein
LPAGQVDGRLAAHRAVDLREQRGRYLHQGDAAHVQRRRETSEIAHDAAADRHEA